MNSEVPLNLSKSFVIGIITRYIRICSGTDFLEQQLMVLAPRLQQKNFKTKKSEIN